MSAINTDQDVTPDMVSQAISILQSIGVDRLCNPTDGDAWDDLPICESPSHEIHRFSSEEEERAFYIKNIVGSLSCIAFVALISGLFMGLMTLDVLDLQIIIRSSYDEDERKYASILLPLAKKRHQLLVTLLTANALAYEALPIFLDAIVPGWVAILLSTTIVMIFGEILPAAIFIGPDQLRLSASIAPIVNVFLVVFYPWAMPLTKLLDYIVQEDPSNDLYNRGELTALVRIQYEERFANKRRRPPVRKQDRDEHTWAALKKELIVEAENEDGEKLLHPPLHKQEVDMIAGALKMKTRLVMDVYTPYRHVYSIPEDLVLDHDATSTIYSNGYSRVPVYRPSKNPDYDNRSNVVGILMTRKLIMIDWDHERTVSTLPLQIPLCVGPRMDLVKLLGKLRTGGSLMAFVCARPDLGNKALDAGLPVPTEAGFMGIVTLEDVMESILQDRIFDEEDIRDRERAVAVLQRWAAIIIQNAVRRRKSKKAKKSLEVNGTEPSDTTPLMYSYPEPSYSSYTETNYEENV